MATTGKFVWGKEKKLTRGQEVELCFQLRDKLNIVADSAAKINSITDEESETNPLTLMILEHAYEAKTAVTLLMESLTAE